MSGTFCRNYDPGADRFTWQYGTPLVQVDEPYRRHGPRGVHAMHAGQRVSTAPPASPG